jgi:hypothetical protein
MRLLSDGLSGLNGRMGPEGIGIGWWDVKHRRSLCKVDRFEVSLDVVDGQIVRLILQLAELSEVKLHRYLYFT